MENMFILFVTLLEASGANLDFIIITTCTLQLE